MFALGLDYARKSASALTVRTADGAEPGTGIVDCSNGPTLAAKFRQASCD